jgi:cell division protein ZapA (FtsZ GTPase activity inhibitor)
MSYALQEQYNSKNQVAGQSAGDVWHLGARRVTSITIHHWGDKGQLFDTVRDFLCTNNTPTSAHYVAQDGLVACIVSPDDCAFHAGNAEGNTFSVGIECRPEATDGDYATVAELIRNIRSIYGDVPLYPHNHWFATACPGDYDLARLDSLARGTTISAQSATITPEGLFMSLTPEEEQRILAAADRINGTVADVKVLNASDGAYMNSTRDAQHASVMAALNTLFTKADGAWMNGQLANNPAKVLNQAFTLLDGTTTNLAGILGQIHAQPAAVPGAPAAVDVDALVARLKAELPAAVLAELTAKLTK